MIQKALTTPIPFWVNEGSTQGIKANNHMHTSWTSLLNRCGVLKMLEPASFAL